MTEREFAISVVQRLHEAGHEALWAGGCVRDELLGLTPKDYDVATDARPQRIRRLFRNSRIIGRRFRLVHVYFRDGIIEVSTFRALTAAPDDGASRGARQRSRPVCLPAAPAPAVRNSHVFRR